MTMTLSQLAEWAKDKERFTTVADWANFCREYLQFAQPEAIQAVIVSTNEHVYNFYQYKEDGNFKITRPLNTDLMIPESEFDAAEGNVMEALKDIRGIAEDMDAPAHAEQFRLHVSANHWRDLRLVAECQHCEETQWRPLREVHSENPQRDRGRNR